MIRYPSNNDYTIQRGSTHDYASQRAPSNQGISPKNAAPSPKRATSDNLWMLKRMYEERRLARKNDLNASFKREVKNTLTKP